MVLLLWLLCCRVLGRVGGIWKSVFRPRRSRLEMLGGCGCGECLWCCYCGYSFLGCPVGWAESGNLSFAPGGPGSGCWVDVVVRSVCVVVVVVVLLPGAWSGRRNLEICLSTVAVSARNVGWMWLYGVSMVLLLWLFCSRVLGRVGGIWKSVSRPRRS